MVLEKMHDQKALGFVAAKAQELKESLVLFYDDASNYVGMLLEVLPEK